MTRIDQLLFGYRDGHELLAGSVAIDSRVEPRLLPHTDARFEDESEHYLVGTHIPELGAYLLARLWPAHEISRPGAVWAHALVIAADDVNELDLPNLVSLFRRPSSDEFSPYEAPLIPRSGPRPAIPDQLLVGLSWARYTARAPTAVVIWRDVVEAEGALLALWANQPRPERPHFSFRTRGRARTGDSPYQIQVAATLSGRSSTESASVLDATSITPAEAPTWVHLIADSLRTPDSDFARLIDRFSDHARSVVELAQLWPLIEPTPQPLAAAEFVSDRFAGPERMRELKRAMFGPGPRNGQEVWRVSESDRVVSLLSVGTDAFLPKDVRLEQRLARLWHAPDPTMVEILAEHQALAPASARLVVLSAAKHLDLAVLAQMSNDPDLLDAVADQRPEAFTEPSFWKATESGTGSIALDWAASSAPPRALTKALVAAEADDLLNRALSLDLDPVIVASELEKRAGDDLSLWPTVFAGHEKELGKAVAAKTRVRPETMLLAAAFLPPTYTRSIGLRRWLAPAKLAHCRDDPPAVVAAACWLALAVKADSETARKLLIECFGPVYRAVHANRLEPRAKSELTHALPAPKKRLDERLRKALVDSMEDRDWSSEDLIRALEPAGREATRDIKLVGKKHPLRRTVDGAVHALRAPFGV